MINGIESIIFFFQIRSFLMTSRYKRENINLSKAKNKSEPIKRIQRTQEITIWCHTFFRFTSFLNLCGVIEDR